MAAKTTIDDIARETGASRTTVSMVLRGRPGIGAETRQRVLDAAEALGYRRRASMRGAEQGTPLTIGLMARSRMREPGAGAAAVNPFYAWVVTGIEAAARGRRMNLIYATIPVDDENEPADWPDHVLESRLDGMLVVGSFSEATIGVIARANPAPLVLVDAPAGSHRHDAVVSDNAGGARAAVRHLIERGHRAIAFGCPVGSVDPNFEQRRDGYLAEMGAVGLAPIEASAGSAADLASVLAASGAPATAVVACNDAYAIELIRTAGGLGRAVPDAFSVVGFDDIDLAGKISPPLTTMVVDKMTMGRAAIEVLAFRLAWPGAARMMTTLQPELIARESVVAGPAGRTG